MAALLGVDVDRTISLTFVMGAALAAVAGLMFMIYYGVVNFNDGFVPGVKAFTAAVLGGIGSLPGAVLGGLLIGLIETLWSAYFSIDYKDVATFSDPGDHAGVHALRAARQAGRGEGVSAMAVDAAEPRPMASARPQQDRGRTQGRARRGAAGAGTGGADPGAAHRAEHVQRADPAAALGLCGDRGAAGVRRAASLPRWRPRLPTQRGARPRPPPHGLGPRARPSAGLIVLLLYPMLALAVDRQGRRHQVDRQFRHPDPDLHHAGLGPEHRRRPRRPARPRLRRLLCRGRLRLRAAGHQRSRQGLHGRVGRGGLLAGVGVLDLPARRRHHGGVLGHPAGLPGAAPARRLSGHRHAGLRRDHPPRAHQLGARHQRLCRHLRHSAPLLLRPAVQRQRRGLCRLLRPGVHARSTAPSSCST